MQKLNTTGVYILSILGFVCCCTGIGWIPSLIALFVANAGLRKYRTAPELYDNNKAMKTAKSIAIVSLVISAIIGLLVIYVVIMLSTSDEFACEFYTKMIEGMRDNPNMTEEALAPYYELQEAACNQL